MENKIINYINQTPENTNPSVLATLLGELKTPKPLTYDYMPEGYPTKSVQTTMLMEEQEVAFTLGDYFYMAPLTSAFEIVVGRKYTVNWDGTEYECIGVSFGESAYVFGSLSIIGAGADTGEPFIYIYNAKQHTTLSATLDTSASHTISVKTLEEVVTPMAEEFLPNTTTGGVTTLHINITDINVETKEPTFTADKTPMEMLQASANGPIWCVVTFAAGLMGEEAASFGVPPTWGAGAPTFGTGVWIRHEENGDNKISDVVTSELPDTWILDLSLFGS